MRGRVVGKIEAVPLGILVEKTKNELKMEESHLKTYITHNQERAIYRAVELLRQAYNLDEQNVPVTWSIIGSAIVSQLEAAFPKVDGSDLYNEIYDYLEQNHWDVFYK